MPNQKSDEFADEKESGKQQSADLRNLGFLSDELSDAEKEAIAKILLKPMDEDELADWYDAPLSTSQTGQE